MWNRLLVLVLGSRVVIAAGMVQPLTVLKNRVAQEIEDAIVALAVEQPAFADSLRQRTAQARAHGLGRLRVLFGNVTMPSAVLWR